MQRLMQDTTIQIRRVTGKRVNSLRLSRREEVVYRLRVGHTGLNAGLCTVCQVREDVDQVLFKCEKYNDNRIIWQEMEGEKSVNEILEEKGTTSERLKALFIYIYSTGFMKRIYVYYSLRSIFTNTKQLNFFISSNFICCYA